MRALRVACLFTAYASLAWCVQGVAALLADDATDATDVPDVPRVDVRLDPVDVDVDVEVDFDDDFRVVVRSSGGCAFEVERRLAVDVSSGGSLRLDVGAGSLAVEGREDASGVLAVGRACASSQELLDELTLGAETSGGDVVLSAHYPDRSQGRGQSARIDLVVTVPAGLGVDIEDTSGEIVVEGTGDLGIADSSGGIEVRRVTGSVRIGDSSGGILLEDASGDVEIRDGSGEIEVRSVGGSVAVRDGSGSIEIENVGADVHVEADGSGSIDVRDVVGDFAVKRDGSGAIRYSGVGGRVEVPERRRR